MDNPRFIQQQETLAKMSPMGANAMAALFQPLNTGGGPAADEGNSKEKKEEVVEEKVEVDLLILNSENCL